MSIASELQFHLCDQFGKYPSKLKLQDINIKERNKSFTKYTKKQSEWLKTRSQTANINRINLARDVLESEKKRLQSAEETLNLSVGAFEAERCEDMKHYLKKLIQCQLFLAMREVESLTKSYEKVCRISPEVERQNWLAEMKQLEAEEQAEDVLLTSK